jgi:hypothetical protein
MKKSNLQELLDIKDSGSLPEMCSLLGDFLGLQEPVPTCVLLRAVSDPTFAADLITCRQAPDFLNALFDDPRTRAYESSPDAAPSSLSSRQLVGRAAEAFMRWGKAGFSTVDAETMERRENACLVCPNLRDPELALQKLISGKVMPGKIGSRTGNKICSLCGCNAGRKLRLPTEACPAPHPTMPGFTRWEEAR